MRWLMVCLVVSAAATAVMLGSASAIERSSRTASSRGVLLGVSGNVASFKSQTGQSSTVVEVFLGWGQGLTFGSPFAELLSRLGPIPMLHLGTQGSGGRELITPAGIASGLGDSYLIALSQAIAEWGRGIYIRPLAEMNNSGSAYSAYNKDGTPKDAAHSAASYRRAFERIYLILHGGSLRMINAKLRGLGLPPVKGGDLAPNPFPGLRLVWSPLAGGVPRTAGNSPSMYYPGDAYVDVEGGDIYDESLTDNAPWTGLETLYRAALSHRKPFSVPEWGLLNVDDSAFIDRMCKFLRTHPSTEMQTFFEGKPRSILNLDSKPKSRAVYRQCITPLAARIPGWAKPRPAIKTDVLTLTPSPTSGSTPLAVQFAIAARLSSPIQHWRILFGDGAQIEGTGQPPTGVEHSYAGDGVYKATLVVYPLPPFTLDAARFFTSADVTVGIGGGQPVAFKATPVSGSEPLKVVFQTDLKLPGTVAHWRVVLDDGFVLQGAGNPPHFTGHTYDRAGSFRPRLIIDSQQNGQLFAYANVVITGTPPRPPPPPATATATGTVVVNGKPFTGGTLRYGSRADVTKGTLTLETAVGTVTVHGGGGSAMFMLLRSSDRGKPVDELRLVGGNFGTCKKVRHSASVHSKRPPPRVVRSLWGKAKGRFRTRGRTAVVSVRGTIWLTADRCDGTLTTVRRGVVEVRNIPRKKTVIVQAGQSYLARSK